MTAEICMMNRLAVVLAADSATTVSHWVDGHREERYFKGANKVFQLTNMQPLGLMIFDSADILNVPWEIVIKSFRSDFGDKSFNRVEDYANELFEYLNTNQRFFPEKKQADNLCRAAQVAAANIIQDAIDGVAPEDRSEAVSAGFSSRATVLASIPFSECLGEEHAEKAISENRESVALLIQNLFQHFEITDVLDVESAADIALRDVLKRPSKYLNTTGLVFAGYGDHEFFPSMVEYVHCGVIGGRHVYERRSQEQIDHDKPAWISAFAQTSMTDTFSLGLSFDVYSSLMLAVVETLQDFAGKVADQSGGQIAAIDDVGSLVQAARDRISNEVLDKARREHSLPLRSVLSVLPVDEMAELAETLITLQSLKEKVTKPSETVGGPVDVAIITKHEGLVWVKRKHFFDPSINSRFSLRQAAMHS